MAAKKANGKKRKVSGTKKHSRGFDVEAFYKKYPHVVRDSVLEVPPDQEFQGVKSHGRVCQVKCAECAATRTVNVQDVWQVKLCAEHHKKAAAAKAAKRRKAKAA